MIDLSKIPDSEKIAKGEFAILHIERRDKREELSNLCGSLMTRVNIISAASYSHANSYTKDIGIAINDAKSIIDDIERVMFDIEELSKLMSSMIQDDFS